MERISTASAAGNRDSRPRTSARRPRKNWRSDSVNSAQRADGSIPLVRGCKAETPGVALPREGVLIFSPGT